MLLPPFRACLRDEHNEIDPLMQTTEASIIHAWERGKERGRFGMLCSIFDAAWEGLERRFMKSESRRREDKEIFSFFFLENSCHRYSSSQDSQLTASILLRGETVNYLDPRLRIFESWSSWLQWSQKRSFVLHNISMLPATECLRGAFMSYVKREVENLILSYSFAFSLSEKVCELLKLFRIPSSAIKVT